MFAKIGWRPGFECQECNVKRELRISNTKFASIEELVTVPNVTAMTEGKRMRVSPRQKTKGDAGFTAHHEAASPLNLMHGMQVRNGLAAPHVAQHQD